MNTTTLDGKSELSALLDSLCDSLLDLFDRRRGEARQRPGKTQRRLLLGLELLWKIEEQVVLPALHMAARTAEPPLTALRQAGDELKLMRDLGMLATQTAGDEREMSLAVLEGMATLHFARVAELLAATPADAVDWPALEVEIRALLARWRGELRTHGEIEDEDRDPVGLPPH